MFIYSILAQISYSFLQMYLEQGPFPAITLSQIATGFGIDGNYEKTKFHLILSSERGTWKYFISYGVLNFLLFLFLPKSVSYSAQVIYAFLSQYSSFNF